MKVKVMFAVLLVLVAVVSLVEAQVAPETIGIPARLGAPGCVSLRGYGMGNISLGEGGYNPAFLADERNWTARYRAGHTEFDNVTSVDIETLEVAFPLGSGAAKVVHTSVDSGWEPFSIVAISMGAPFEKRIRTDDITALYGWRANKRVRLGVAVASQLNSNVEFRFAGIPLAEVKGRVLYNGARVGAVYDLGPTPDDVLALQYDDFGMKGTATDLIHGASVSDRFRFRDLTLGIQRRLGPRWIVATEVEKGSFRGSLGYDQDIGYSRVGAEYQVNRHLFLRAGMADGEPTFGLGYQRGRFSADLAYMVNQYEDELGPYFGDSRTTYLALTWQN